MKVTIEFEIDAYDLNESAADDLLDDWTYEIRTTRRLKSWNIDIQGKEELLKE